MQRREFTIGLMIALILNSCQRAIAWIPMQQNYTTADPNLRYVGRFEHQDSETVRFTWSASQIHWRFTGTSCTVELQAGPNPDGWCNYFTVIIDDRAPAVLKLDPEQTEYRVAENLEPGEHTCTIFKRTEGWFPVVTFRGIQLDWRAKLLPVESIPPYRLEFIGDSITCGYGNEATSGEEEFSDVTENAYQSYAAIAARLLDADLVTICRSGFGLIQNYDQSTDPTMAHLYDRTLTQEPIPWDFQTFIPDIVVINLGTNDFAHAPPEQDVFVNAYLQLIERIHNHYPQAEIVGVIGPVMADTWPYDPVTDQPYPSLTLMRQYLEQVQRESQGESDHAFFHVVEFTPQTPERGYGADFHPNIAQHQLNGEELADFLRPLIGT